MSDEISALHGNGNLLLGERHVFRRENEINRKFNGLLVIIYHLYFIREAEQSSYFSLCFAL